MLTFLRQLLKFSIEYKKLWIAPVMLFIMLLGGLVVLAESSAVLPLIYALF